MLVLSSSGTGKPGIVQTCLVYTLKSQSLKPQPISSSAVKVAPPPPKRRVLATVSAGQFALPGEVALAVAERASERARWSDHRVIGRSSEGGRVIFLHAMPLFRCDRRSGKNAVCFFKRHPYMTSAINLTILNPVPIHNVTDVT